MRTIRWGQAALLTFIIADIIAILALALFVFYVSQPLVVEGGEPQTVVIGQGLGVGQIADKLAELNLVHNRDAFVAYAFLSGQAYHMQAGVYELHPSMSVRDMVTMIGQGNTVDQVRVVIPEGFTIKKIASRLRDAGVIDDPEAFERAAFITSREAFAKYGYAFLNEVPEANTLEGFLFPDTYEFRVQSNPSIVIDAFLFNFQNKVGDTVVQTEDFYEKLIIASLLQREVRGKEDMAMVTGVIENRFATGMPLQIDATLVYIVNRVITASDKTIDSPYNSYKYKGLPPTPIANPGLQAIDAALNPIPNDYIFYISGRDGTTHFAKTFAEHNNNIAKYLR